MIEDWFFVLFVLGIIWMPIFIVTIIIEVFFEEDNDESKIYKK